MKAVIPSPRRTERIVYMLANNAIYAYSKDGIRAGFVT